MNWGYKIFFTFLVFGAMIITMVVISVRQDVNLVSEDYYQKELDFQSQIDKSRNYNNLSEKPEFIFNKEDGSCILSFPDELVKTSIKGTVHFYRPSSSVHDKIFSLDLEGNTSVEMDINGLIEGMWKIKVDWTDGNQGYYFEKPVYL